MLHEQIQKQLGALMSLFLVVATVLLAALTVSTINKLQHPAPMQNYITVNGVGKTTITPDLAVINFGVRSEAESTQEAQKENTETVNALISAVKALNIDTEDLKTQNYSVYENFTFNPQTGARESAGWAVSQSIEIKVRDTEKVSAVLNLAGQYGVTDVNGPNFQIDDMSVYQAQARESAIADAKEQAKRLARSLNIHLGDVTGYNEWTDGGYYPRYAYAESAVLDSTTGGSSPSPAVEPGQNEITLNVSVTYMLR